MPGWTFPGSLQRFLLQAAEVGFHSLGFQEDFGGLGWAASGSARWAEAQANSSAGSGWQLDTVVILLELMLTHPLKSCGEKTLRVPPGLCLKSATSCHVTHTQKKINA